jgi:hypothetical protein
MAYEIVNRQRAPSVIRVDGPGTTTVVAANLSSNVLNETVNSFSIKRLFWSTNGSIVISRSGNNMISLHNTGEIRFDDWGYSLSNTNSVAASTANLSVVIATGGSCLIEVSKETTYATPLIG